MQHTLASLSKKAIDAALKTNWESAIQINTQILDSYPEDIDARLRLGRAFIQTKQFSKAQKLFKEVLKKDPINSVAKKNLELASKNQTDSKTNDTVNTKSLLMEPGKCTECRATITAKGVTANEFTPGEELFLKVKKRSIEIIKVRKGTKVPVGTIEDKEIVKKANDAKDTGARLQAAFVKGLDKTITILIKSTVPIFRSAKQEIRPYIKKGSIDEEDIPAPGELGTETELS